MIAGFSIGIISNATFSFIIKTWVEIYFIGLHWIHEKFRHFYWRLPNETFCEKGHPDPRNLILIKTLEVPSEVQTQAQSHPMPWKKLVESCVCLACSTARSTSRAPDGWEVCQVQVRGGGWGSFSQSTYQWLWWEAGLLVFLDNAHSEKEANVAPVSLLCGQGTVSELPRLVRHSGVSSGDTAPSSLSLRLLLCHCQILWVTAAQQIQGQLQRLPGTSPSLQVPLRLSRMPGASQTAVDTWAACCTARCLVAGFCLLGTG